MTTTDTASVTNTTGDQRPSPAAHTAGPWAAIRFHSAWWKIYRGVSEGPAICQLFDKHDQPFLEAEANARLIAAAPEMLMALQMALPALEWCEKQWADSPQHGDGVNVLSFARAAIAKATGAA